MKYLILVILLNFRVTHAQSLNENKVSKLPNVLNESSGLERDGDGNFWSHNDSGGEPELYHFSEDGILLHTIKIANVQNNDWEDIALGSDGRMFVGDFGNNGNNREDLMIYIVNVNNLNPGFNLRSASIINFSYSEQTAFPPSDSKKNFDAEAMIYKNDSLFIFTKNRTQPFDGKCYQYYLPAIAGSYEISRSDTFYIIGADVESRVVGADFDTTTNKLALLTSTKVLIFNAQESNKLISSSSEVLSFVNITQKEGICWGDSCKLYFSDEFIEILNLGGRLYSAEICDPLHQEKFDESEFVIFPQPSSELIFIKIKKNASVKRNISGELLTSSGDFVNKMNWNSSENKGEISTKNLQKGLYLLHLKENNLSLNVLKIMVY